MKTFTIVSLLLLTACATERVKPIEDCAPIYKWSTYDCGVPPARDHITLQWLNGWLIDKDGNWTLSPDHYATLGDDMAEIIKGSGQLKELVLFYERCIDAAQGLADDERTE